MNLSNRITYLILFTLLLYSSAYCQENAYLNFSVAEGLPSSEVYYSIQDKKGFIWFATDNGVVRYDGSDFDVINTQQGLSDPVVFAIHEDPFDRIWFRTFTGKLSYFQDGKVHKYKYNDLVVNLSGKGILSDMYYDSLDQLWFTAADKLVKIDKNGKATTTLAPTYSIDFYALNQERDLVTSSGPAHRINKIKINNQHFPIHLTDTTKSFGVVCNIRWMKTKYISINQDLFEFNNGLNKVFTAASPIISLSIDKEEKLWIGTLSGGVHRVQDRDFKKTFTINELKGKSVTHVLQDDEKGFWISTLEKGVFYFPNFSITKYNLPEDSKMSSANEVAGKVITTDYSGKILAHNKDNAILWEKDFGIPITTSFISSLNQIWVANNSETLILNDNGEVVKSKLPSSIIDFSSTPTHVYGVNSVGLYKFDHNGDLITSKELNTRFRNIHVTADNIYMGGKNGLFLYDHNFNFLREQKEYTDIKVSHIEALTDSILLITTIGNGFLLFNTKSNETIARYNTTSGFIANNIYDVLKLNSTIWLGTEKGIAIVNTKSLLSGKPEFDFITKLSGLASDKVNFLIIQQREIWAFCDDGFSKLPLNNIRYINQNPIAYIQEVKVNNDTVDLYKPLHFDYRQNNIRIGVGFLSFNNQNILARFRLTPNAPWTSSGNWTFAFNSLEPGQYKFQAEYSTDNLNWYLAPIEMNFQIHPAWWNTWYFRIGLGIIVFLIGTLLYKRRIGRYQERNDYLRLINEQQKKLLEAEIEATERERSRIAKDLHDGIGMDLVSIKLMTNQLAKKTDDKDALEIHTQLQKTISEIQNIIYGLTPSGLKLFGLSHGLENYITMVLKNHSIDIRFDFQGDEVKDQQLGAMIFRIIQELVTNSIKHAHCNKIHINLMTTSTQIQITYHDNGVGFNPNKAKPGLGLSNIRSRVESLAGKIDVESGGANGTNYSINLPMAK